LRDLNRRFELHLALRLRQLTGPPVGRHLQRECDMCRIRDQSRHSARLCNSMSDYERLADLL
jgi:hypothetical protein